MLGERGNSPIVAKADYDSETFLHSGSIVRGWHCFVNVLNTVSIVFALSVHLCTALMCYVVEVRGLGSSAHRVKHGSHRQKKKKPDHVVREYFSMLTGKGLELKLQKSGQFVFKVGDVNLIAPGLC